jgi:hypothetical protein
MHHGQGCGLFERSCWSAQDCGHLIVFSSLSFSFSLLLTPEVLVLTPEETAVWWSELNKQEGDAKGRTDKQGLEQRRCTGWKDKTRRGRSRVTQVLNEKRGKKRDQEGRRGTKAELVGAESKRRGRPLITTSIDLDI